MKKIKRALISTYDKTNLVELGKILADCKTEQELYEECVRAYGGDEDRVIENGRLLWLRREEKQIWQPPKFTDSDQD